MRLMDNLFHRSEMFAELLRDCEAKLSKDPNDLKGLLFRGLLLNIAQAYDKAIADLSKVIAFRPEDHEAYYLRSDCHFNQSDYVKAKQDYMRALKAQMGPADKDLSEKFSEANIQAAAIEYDNELEALKQALDKEKEFLLASYNFRTE